MIDSVHSQKPMIIYAVADQYTSTSDRQKFICLKSIGKLPVVWILGWWGLNPKSVISRP